MTGDQGFGGTATVIGAADPAWVTSREDTSGRCQPAADTAANPAETAATMSELVMGPAHVGQVLR